jgi:hypothetical protein
MKKIKTFIHFEGNRNFDEYGPNYRKPIIQDLEDLLIEVFDVHRIPESTVGVCLDYTWWNDMDKYITVGNIPDDIQATLLLDDLYRIKEKVELRLNREVYIRKGRNSNGPFSNSTFWITISPK